MLSSSTASFYNQNFVICLKRGCLPLRFWHNRIVNGNSHTRWIELKNGENDIVNRSPMLN